MVPPACDAHLDDVEGDVVGLRQLFQLRLVLKRPALRGECPAKGEQHVNELRLLADWAVGLRRLTQVGSDPYKFGLGVTDVETRCLTTPDAADRGVSSEAIFDLTQARRGKLVHLGFGSTAHELSR